MKLFKIVVTMLLLLSCDAQNEQKAEANSFKTTRFEDDVLDTILERNNPANLDLSRHQFFIDTTRNSEFYQRIADWKPWEFEIENYTEEKSFKKYSIGKFPRVWISLRKLDGKFVIYDRCDGIDRRFQITDSTINIFGPLENEVQIIDKVLKQSVNEISIEYKPKNLFSIMPTNDKNIYILQYDDENYLVTPLDKIREFDLVVNHYPTRKVTEFDVFDE
jgi:hypothetical protein